MISQLSQVYNLLFGILLVFVTGLVGGFVSGFLGIGCGIIITPMLMEFGVPPLTAIATQLCHAVGTNLTNFLTYKRKHDVDFHLASYMLIGGTMGAICEWMFLEKYSTQKTAFDKFVYVYVTVLVIVGIVMLSQSISEWRNGSEKQHRKGVLMRRWMLYLPFHRIFARSRSEMSILIPIFVGFLAGVLVAALGGGSNLFMVPIITYLIGRISPVVNGTTSVVSSAITVVITLIYSRSGYCCDIIYVLLLFAGAAFGSMIGVKLTYNARRSHTYAIAVVVVFAMATRQIFWVANGAFLNGLSHASLYIDIGTLPQLAKDRPLAYTTICLFVVIMAALLCEKFMRKMLGKGKHDVAR
ncbi:MAG: sulfite exporter TauE/SafE family protein [Holosporales bacterium]|nr:sulfite exporter TauE/SafE family protein [Holosporales bacterium]